MKKLSLVAAAAGAVVAASAWSAQAMPAAPISGALNAPIEHVAGGCGPGMHPTRWGGCRPFGWRPGPRVVVAPGFRRGFAGRGFVGRPYRHW